ncbi:HAMP domain-containing histidine kinase, partial [Enterococcus cecorum]
VFLLIILIIYWIYRGLIKETEGIFLEAIRHIESVISSSKTNCLPFCTDDLIAKFYHQLNRLTEIKQQNLQQVEEDYQKLSDSLTEIAHQLRTPLATLIAYTELLAKENLNIQAKEYYLRIKQSTEKITALVEKFILASRLEQRIIHIQKQMKPLEPTIAKAIFQIYPQAKEKGVEVDLEVDSGLKVMHDSIWLE